MNISDIPANANEPTHTPEQMEDAAHRMACLVKYGPGCCCAEYAAITGLMHPDCAEHGYIIGRPKRPKTKP